MSVTEYKILVSDSLQETLWRLEEVRRGFREKSDMHIKEALDWVLSRQGVKGSYCNLFLPTDQDLTQGAQVLTGEHVKTSAATRHILGEEALRTLIIWDLESSKPAKRATEGLEQIIERGGKKGSYCCYNCTIAFLRTLAVAKVDARDEILERGLSKIKRAQSPDGRWHGFPFYYTLLFLSEIDSPYAKNELKHAKKTAERLLKRYSGRDRISLFRSLALRAALDSM
jgi:hypothetical protein